MAKKLLFQILLPLILVSSVWAQPQIDVGSLTVGAGTPSVTVPVTLTNQAGTSIYNVAVDISYDTTFFNPPTVALGAAATAAGKTLQSSTPSTGVIRIGAVDFNVTQQPIGNGTVFNVTFPLKATNGSTVLFNTPSAFDIDANPVTVSGNNGSVSINTNAPVGHTINGSVNIANAAAYAAAGYRAYIVVTPPNGGTSGLGTSFAVTASQPQSFSIRGVPPGSWGLGGFVDVNNTGTLHAYDPIDDGSTSNQTITTGDITFPQLSISPQTAATPVFDPNAKLDNIAVTAGSVLIQFQGPKAQIGGGGGPSVESATSYTVYWGTAAKPGVPAGQGGSTAAGSKPFAAAASDNFIINGLSGTLFFTLKASNAAGDAYLSSTNSYPIVAPTGGATVSGIVNSTGVTKPAGSLYVALGGSNGFFIARPASGAVNDVQSWSIAGVPPGTYTVYTVLDMDGDGIIGTKDLQNGNGNAAPTINVVDTNPVTAPSITLVNRNAQVSVTTNRFSSGNNSSYSLTFRVRNAVKRPASAFVSGPGLPVTTDIGFSLNDKGLEYWTGSATAPVVGDSYPFTITYSDGTSETINATVTAVLGPLFSSSFVYPANNTAQDSQTPLFSWRSPQWIPSYYNYRLQVSDNNGSQVWNPGDHDNPSPMTQVALPFNADGSANPTVLSTGSQYNWNISLVDGNGNSATTGGSFTPQSSGPVISSFSPTFGQTGISVNILGSGFGGNPSVTFGGVPAPITSHTSSSITATVPTGAPVGPITVTASNVTGSSTSTFNATVTFNGTINDSSSVAVNGATVSVVDTNGNVLNDPAGAALTVTTPADGSYAFTNRIPSGVPFAIRISKTGYFDITTSLMNPSKDTTGVTYILYPTASALPTMTPALAMAANKGVIISRVIDWDTSTNVSGVTFTTSSFLHPATPYAVSYSSGSSTTSNGLFAVNGVDEGDYVAVNGNLSGWGFQPRVYVTHASGVSENSLRGTPLPTVSASPAGGNFSSPQSVALSTDVGRPTGTIYYTTDGSDPTANGSNPQVYFSPIPVGSGTTTLKYYTVNTHNIAGPVGSATYTVVIAQPSTTTINLNSSTVTYGQPAGASATVTAGATGTVQFQVDGTNCGSAVALTSGSAGIDLQQACQGLIQVSGSPHVVAANYSGDNFYQPSSSTRTLTVTKANQTITFTGPITKTYGSAPFAPATTSATGLAIVYSSDNTAVATGGSTITIVGAGNANITASQPGDSNYNAAAPKSVLLTVNPKNLTASGVKANNRIYDGTTAATLDFSTAGLVGVVGGDAVTLSVGSATASFNDKNVGNGKPVTVSGLALLGAASGNYTLSQPTGITANITTKALTVSGVTANSKPYDRTVTGSLNLGSAALVGVINPDVVTINTASAAGVFPNKNVGVNRTVTVTGIAITGADAPNYTVTQPTGITADITPLTLGVTGLTANNKVYDGTSTALLNTGSASLTGILAGDTVTISGSATGTFADKNVGNGKTVTIAGLALAGTDSGNYVVGTVTTTANITPKGLTVSGITAGNKVYDRTTGATLNTASAALVGIVNPDVVTLNVASAVGSFADKTVANNKTVTISGITIGGADVANYTVTQPTATANITPASITVSGVTANNKTYDRTTTAGLNLGSAALVGVIAGDTVTINTASAAGAFADKTVANGKAVTVSGITIGGGDAPNYTVTQPTGITANITAKSVTVSGFTANNKVYDGTTAATVNTGATTLSGVITGDVVSISGTAVGTFATKNVGNGISVSFSGLSLTGTDAANYNLTGTTTTTTANITPATLTISGVTASNKVYDRTTSASINTGSAALVGVIAPDVVTINAASATGVFANKTVGNGKTVTVSGIALGGADAGNYTVTQPTATANITPVTLTVNGVIANNKVYDGTVTAGLNTSGATLSGILTGDVVSISGSATGSFADKNVGNGKTVTIVGLSLAGADAPNYVVATVTTTANITVKGLTVTGITASSKVYDQTTTAALNVTNATLSGVVVNDVVSLSTASAAGAFADKNVGNARTVTVSGLTISGTDSGNYTLTQPTTTANITTKGLTVTGITASDKTYDRTATAALSVTNAALSGVITNDVVTLSTASAAGAFADKNAGNGKTVTVSGLTISGTDAGNYSLAQPTTTANITAKQISVTGISASSKVYDATATASLNTSGATLAGVIAGDTVSISGTATGTFADKNVGTAKTVTIAGLALAGADAGNYTVATVTSTANVTAKPVIITGLTAFNKVYDGTTTADGTGTAVANGFINGDTVSLVANPTGTFNNKNVGTAKPVTVTGFSLTGADATNYSITPLVLSANITAKPVNVTGLSAATRVYDRSAVAGVTGTAVTADFVVGDTVSLTGTPVGSFATKTIGTAKPVTVTGISLTGVDSTNYNLQPITLSADITAKQISVTGVTANNKTYDGTATAALNTASAALSGVISGDAVSISGTATGTFADKNVGTGKTVTIAGLALSGADSANYTVVTVTTTANIAPAVLTVTATDVSRPYDSANPALIGYAVTGYVNGETVAVISGTPSLTTTATTTSAAGNYPITITQGTLAAANGNYTFTMVNGTLVVTKLPATVSFGNLAFDFGSVTAPTVTVTPTTDAGTGAALTYSITYNGSSTLPSAAGTYAVVATVTSPNYQGSASGTMTIVKSSTVKGDVNGDGKADITDALLTMRNVAKLVTFTTAQTTAADVNNDHSITMADVLLLMRKAVGLPVNF